MNPPGVVKIHIMLDTKAELWQADTLFQFHPVFRRSHRQASADIPPEKLLVQQHCRHPSSPAIPSPHCGGI